MAKIRAGVLLSFLSLHIHRPQMMRLLALWIVFGFGLSFFPTIFLWAQEGNTVEIESQKSSDGQNPNFSATTANLQERVLTSEDRIRNLERLLDELRQRTIANHEKIQKRLDDLLGAIETLRNRIDNLQSADLDGSTTTDTKNNTPHQPEHAVEDSSQPASISATEQYQRAYQLLVDKKLIVARQALEQFLTQHPDSNLADNAHYWIGETYFAEKNYTQASKQFSYAFETYPNSNKAPDNLLKLGISLLRLEKQEEACITFVALLDRFKNAPLYIKDRTKGLIANLSCPS